MISHKHRCIFTHVPKSAGKSILAAFGLPMLARQYDNSLSYIEAPYGHLPLSRHWGGPEFAYFKFAFVRNPWDRLVSAFHYLDDGGCNRVDAAFRDAYLARYHGDFAAFVHDLGYFVPAQHFRPQVYWLCDTSGALLANFVGRYERLVEDFALVAERLSLPSALPRLNPSEHAHYREYYDQRTCAIVANIYRNDIQTFGYDF